MNTVKKIMWVPVLISELFFGVILKLFGEQEEWIAFRNCRFAGIGMSIFFWGWVAAGVDVLLHRGAAGQSANYQIWFYGPAGVAMLSAVITLGVLAHREPVRGGNG